METDISRKYALEQDAKQLEDTAQFLRKIIDEKWDKLPEWARMEKERELRVRIKYSIEALIHNLQC